MRATVDPDRPTTFIPPQPAPAADRLHLRSWCALGMIAGLIVFHQLLLQPALMRLTSDAPVINIAGRQRMLSQRLAKAALALEIATSAHDAAAHRRELREVLIEWTRAHRGLLHGDTSLQLPGRNSIAIVNAFRGLEPHFQAIVSAGEELLSVSGQPLQTEAVSVNHAAVSRILDHEAEFLRRMHAIVGLYEEDARLHVQQLQRMGLAIMAAILAVLLTVQLAVVQPAVTLVRREFAQSEEQYRHLVESMNDGLVVHDRQGRVLFANRRFGDLLGYPAAELLGRPAAIFVADSDRRRYDQLRESPPPPSPVEIALQHRGGQIVEVMASPQRWLNREGQPHGCLFVVTDITARKQAEQRSRELQDQLVHADRLKSMGEMAAGLAHEINQPLGAIANYAEGSLALLARGSVDSGELQRPLRGILQAALRGGEIIRRARRFAQLRPHRRADESINDLVRDVEQLCLPEARRRGVSLQIDAEPDIPALFVDGVQIQQVLMNLIQNAFEAMEETEPYRRRLIVRTRCVGEDAVEISVTDTGRGVRNEDLLRIFEPFVTTRPDGMGMGLAIVRGIVEAHGGDIVAESNADGGATFRCTLTRHAPAAQASAVAGALESPVDA